MRKARNCVIYQVFLRNFCDEGTFEAATKCLEHIASLGVDYVYLGAMNVADPDPDPRHYSIRNAQSGFNNPKNPYRISDYYHVDPEYGTDEDFKVFVKKAHELGLGVLMDLVYLHCGPSHPLIKEHPEYFIHRADGTIDGGHYNMCLFDYNQPGLRKYMTDNMLYWVNEFGVDGFRCDCGGAVPYFFWEEAVKEVKKVKPDLFMIDEIWPEGHVHCQDHLNGDAFDLVYGFMHTQHLNNLLKTPKMTVRDYENAFKKVSGSLPKHMFSISGLDNHDTVLDAWYERPEALLPAKAIEATCCLSFLGDTVPIIYNGFEIADGRRHSCFANRFCSSHIGVDWMKILTAEGQARMEYVRKMVKLVHEHSAFAADAEIEFETNVPDTVIAFSRRSSDEHGHVVINLSDKNVEYENPEDCKTELWAQNAKRVGNKIQLGAFGYVVEI